MRKSKFRYNPLTLSFERIDVPFSKKLAKVAIHFGYSLVIAAVFTVTYSFFFDTPKEKILKRNVAETILGFEMLEKRIAEATSAIDIIQRRDNQIYRSIFEADTIPSTIRLGGFGGASPYTKFEGLKNADVLMQTTSLLDKLSWKVYIQSKSFDEVIVMAKNKEKMVQSVPAIQPISVKEMVRISDTFGFRRDPFTKNYKKHLGVDFVGPVGIPIYVTGNGTVVSAEFSFFGYGNVVVVDHGFGYKSRYAHLFKISVTKGQQVARGQVIGELGNSGRSTGPHLHYEVLLRENQVDPINYFNDMSSEEYELMVNNTSKKEVEQHLD